MATRRNIKVAVRDDIITAVGSAVPNDRIVYTGQEARDLAYPQIVYSLFDSLNDLHGTKPTPYRYTTDSNGNKDMAVYAAHYTSFVDISIEGETADTDSLYEDVRQQFLKYHMFKSDTDLHADVTDVMVSDASTDVNMDTEPSVFSSMVSLEIDYTRDVKRDGTPIDEIHQKYDLNDDGTTDRSHTTT